MISGLVGSPAPPRGKAPHVKRPDRPKLRDILGPGLITGASDDDPSGIATYSQAGAQFGYGLTWTLLFSYPLMVAIQQISARIGRVTGIGLAGNLRKHFPAGRCTASSDSCWSPTPSISAPISALWVRHSAC
jgi:Mn2+/Fe2+ NRAMP family transporter